MKWRTLFPLLVISLCSPISMATQQPPAPVQASSASPSQRLKWSEPGRKALLAKAQRGDRDSQMWLGAAYEQGWFGTTNLQAALKWFRRAAAQGDPDAQNSLGQMYEDGEGVQQDYNTAAKWYRKAAEHVPDFGGAGQGRNNLGALYLNGLGVPKDYVRAYVWFRLSNSERNLSYTKNHMTPTQVLKAERMASNWKILHPEPPRAE